MKKYAIEKQEETRNGIPKNRIPRNEIHCAMAISGDIFCQSIIDRILRPGLSRCGHGAPCGRDEELSDTGYWSFQSI
jgi:hypothetical protein